VENIYLGVAENHLFSDKFSYMNKANKGYEVDEKRNINKSDISHFVTEQKNKEIIVLC
jgi:3-oxoacyl-[acyl-carrier-protein] synthase III